MGRDGQYVQCKRESFEGGSQRGYGDGVKEKRSLGKLSNLPASHSEFSDLLKEGKHTHPPKKRSKSKTPNPILVTLLEIKARQQTVLRMGTLDFFTASAGSQSPWLGVSPNPSLECSNYTVQ